MKKRIFVTILALTLMITGMYSVYAVNSKGRTIIKTKSDTEVVVENGKVKENSLVKSDSQKKKILVNDYNAKSILLIDESGTEIDSFDDIIKGFEEKQVPEKLKETKYNDYFIAGSAIVDNTIYLVTNYDNSNGYIWKVDLETRKYIKVFDAPQYEGLGFLHANSDQVIAINQETNTLVSSENGNIIEIQIPGHVLSTSNDAKTIMYKEVVNDTLQKDLIFFNVDERKSSSYKFVDDYFYAHGGVWSDNGEYFCFVERDRLNLEEYTSLKVIDVKTGKELKLLEKADWGLISKEVDALQFFGDILRVTLDDASYKEIDLSSK